MKTVERLSELLTGDGYRDILFVADCALVNTVEEIRLGGAG